MRFERRARNAERQRKQKKGKELVKNLGRGALVQVRGGGKGWLAEGIGKKQGYIKRAMSGGAIGKKKGWWFLSVCARVCVLSICEKITYGRQPFKGNKEKKAHSGGVVVWPILASKNQTQSDKKREE